MSGKNNRRTLISTFGEPEYRWLSNFHPCPVMFEGRQYPSVEHAYQAAKTLDDEERKYIFNSGTAAAAKAAGKNVKMRDDWPEVKVQIMKELLREKFSAVGLRDRLLNTAPMPLVEGNYWHDTFWGVCNCSRCNGAGTNMLGLLLMALRTELAAV